MQIERKHLPEMADWLAARYAPYGEAGAARVCVLLDWYNDRQMVGAIRERGELRAIGMARVVSRGDVEAYENPMEHDPDGDTLWIELVAGDKECWLHLMRMAARRFGPRKWVAWRNNKRGKVEFVTINQLKRRFLWADQE